jgi:PAS domain S-box-containing protein
MGLKPANIVLFDWLAATADGADAQDDEPQAGALASLLRMVLDDGPPTRITDGHGRPLYTNRAYERIAAPIAEAAIDLDDPDTADDGEHAIVIDGRTEKFHVRRKRVPDTEGTGDLVATVFTPVTEKRASDAATTRLKERFDDIARLVSDWVWETNRNLVLTFVSPRVSDVLGYHQVELTGRSLTDLPATPNETLKALHTEAAQRPFRNVEVEIPDRAGEARTFLLSGLPFYCPEDGSFLGFRGTARDITEIKWREAALREAKDNAELANRTKSEFLANMSHELRTPLNAIIGFSEIMQTEILGPLGNDQYKGYAEDITDSARHLLVLINEILDAAKIEAGQMALCEDAIDPGSLVESVRRLMAARAARGEVTLESVLRPALPAIYADETKLKQILINLASNAIKFTPSGGRVELRAETTETGEFVFIISDTGIGISEDDIPKALAPFGQVDSRISRKFDGTGLGLPLAKSLTELHGGRFSLVSQPNVGTTVTVHLPAARVIRS